MNRKPSGSQKLIRIGEQDGFKLKNKMDSNYRSTLFSVTINVQSVHVFDKYSFFINSSIERKDLIISIDLNNSLDLLHIELGDMKDYVLIYI